MTTVITARRLGTGLLAVAGIAGILIGVPVALWALGGNPLPTTLPSLGQVVAVLTHPDDGHLFLRALTLAGWIGWISYALPLVLELLRAVAGIRIRRLPLLRLQHRQSAALVAAAGALLGMSVQTAHASEPRAPHLGATATAAASQVPALPQSETSQAQAHRAHLAHLAHQQHLQTRTAEPQVQVLDLVEKEGERPVLYITVKPGDTLSEIAEDELDDASRWPEIARASRAITQDDGKHLTDPDLIYPGWQLNVPGGEEGTHSTQEPRQAPSQAPSQSTHGEADTASPSAAPSASTPAAPSSRASAPAAPATPEKVTPTGAATPPQAPTAAPSVPADNPSQAPSTFSTPSAAAPAGPQDSQRPDQDSRIDPQTQMFADEVGDHVAPVLFTVAGLASLGAAGLVAALARRRRQQSRHRRPGQRVPLPTGDAAVTESQLRAAADPLTADHLDRALRTLAAHARHNGDPVPGLNAARITTDALELYLADVAATLPAPFTPIEGDPGAWTFDRHNLDHLLTADEAADVAAPYPSLVTLGADESDAILMLNLEQVGAFGLTGPPGLCHEVLTALAVELVTSTWCDDSRITLIGVLPELVDAVGSERATFIPDLEAALPALDYMAKVHRDALEREGLDSTAQARDRDVLDTTWTPHIILVSAHLHEEDRARIAQLVAEIPRVAVAAITTGSAPVGKWHLHVSQVGEEIVGDLVPSGLQITPQHLSLTDFRRILDVFAVADQPPVPGPAWADGIADGVRLEDLPDNISALEDAEAETAPAPGRTGSHVAVLAGTVTDFPAVAPAPVEAHEHDDLDESAEEQDEPERVAAAPEAGTALTESLEAVSAGAATQTPLSDHQGDEADVVDVAKDSIDGGEEETDAAPAAPSREDETSGDPTVADEETAPQDEVVRRVHLLTPTSSEKIRIDADDLPDERMLVRLLGPVEVHSGAGRTTRPPARTREIVAYLALMPGLSEQAFSEALWRGERPTGEKIRNKRNQYLARARSWIGATTEGRPYIGYVDDIGYALDPATSVDWWRFREHLGDGLAEASDQDLAAALKLVTGRPLSGIDPTRFVWAESVAGELIDAIGDVACELATRALHTGDTRIAIWAIEKGLLADDAHEALWRLRIAAAVQAHASVRDVVARMHASLDDDTGDLAPETLALINAAYDRVPA